MLFLAAVVQRSAEVSSEVSSEPYNCQQMVICSYVDRQEKERLLVLIGHSMGGVVIQVAHRTTHPLILSLALANPAYCRPSMKLDSTNANMESAWMQLLGFATLHLITRWLVGLDALIESVFMVTLGITPGLPAELVGSLWKDSPTLKAIIDEFPNQVHDMNIATFVKTKPLRPSGLKVSNRTQPTS
jgi:pimeloyl-ACP methyl ester carboxylesterase